MKSLACVIVGGWDATTRSDLWMTVRERVANRIQLTSDGHKAYAVEGAFGADIDHAMLVKVPGKRGPYKKQAAGGQDA